MDLKSIIEGLEENKEEILKKASQCRNAEELLALAKENSIAITLEEANELFAMMNSNLGELSENELDSVAGGYWPGKGDYCPNCRLNIYYCQCKK